MLLAWDPYCGIDNRCFHVTKHSGIEKTVVAIARDVQEPEQVMEQVFPNLRISISSEDPPHGKKKQAFIEASTFQEKVESDELRNESGELDKTQTANEAKHGWVDHSIFPSKNKQWL